MATYKNKIEEIYKNAFHSWEYGMSLKMIYDWLHDVYGLYGSYLMCGFTKENKENEKFMKEFNTTAFVE